MTPNPKKVNDGSSGPVKTLARLAPQASEGMRGLAKGLAVLEAFAAQSSRLTVSEAARAADISPAAARRCLLTLTDVGYVAYDGKYFRPTPRLLRLGATYLEVAPLPVLAQPHLEAIREALQESVSLAVLEDGCSVFVARAETTQREMITGLRVGTRLPAYSTATGRILLAALPDRELNAYLAGCEPQARTPKTLVDREEIRARIMQARQDGVTSLDQELEIGVLSLAIPVIDGRGRTQAAMSVSTLAARVTLEQMHESFLGILREQADQIGHML